MGLTAAVFHGLSTLSKKMNYESYVIDDLTGEVTIFDSCGDEIHADNIAISIRIGSLSEISSIRKRLDDYLPQGGSLIKEKILYSGSHSGDVINKKEIDGLDAELKSLKTSEDSLLQKFSTDLWKVILVARNENNPIVFL